MYLKRSYYSFKTFFYFTSCLLSVTSHDNALRAVGGRDAAPGEFPYVLKMDLKVKTVNETIIYAHICTCSLLKSTWSLTAGHCIVGLHDHLSKIPTATGVIRYNLSSVHEPPSSSILSTFLHPSYVETSTYVRNDIGLLRSEKVTMFSFAKLSSVDYLSLFGSKVLALGFGLTKDSSGYYGDAYSVNKSLQVLDTIIIKCFESFVYPSFCLGGICGRSSSLCPGDSGGPVMHTSGIVGVNSAGIQFSVCNIRIKAFKKYNKFQAFPGMITPMSVYIDWITNILQSHSPKNVTTL